MIIYIDFGEDRVDDMRHCGGHFGGQAQAAGYIFGSDGDYAVDFFDLVILASDWLQLSGL